MHDESARSRRAKFLGFVAHEIKNPLSTALWSADLLRRLEAGDRAGPRAERMMDASLRALRRMRRLVEDYFTIERLGENLLELRRDKVEVKGLVDGALGLFAEKDREAAKSFAIDVPAALHASCDLELCKRALRAVLEQALRAGEGPLTIAAARSGDGVAIWAGRREGNKTALMPPPPEDQPGGDPDGSVLGMELAHVVARAHGGTLLERDGGLELALPAA